MARAGDFKTFLEQLIMGRIDNGRVYYSNHEIGRGGLRLPFHPHDPCNGFGTQWIWVHIKNFSGQEFFLTNCTNYIRLIIFVLVFTKMGYLFR
jgi:hypothetical protein